MKKSLQRMIIGFAAATLLASYVVVTPSIIMAQDTSSEEVAETTEEAEDNEPMEKIEDEGIITKADLLAANGQDGAPAYVAVFGRVYDVSEEGAFAEGEHNGVKPGTDASAAFLESIHASDLLEKLPLVGEYVDWEISSDLLSSFNGENADLPVLVAIDGLVYDVTDVEAWAGGEHQNEIKAGQDVSEFFAKSPHAGMEDFLDKLPVVGFHTDYVYSAEKLAEFNGQDGANAYVAVDGVVYNLTNSAAWTNGEHNGVKAGTDATEAFKNSPHAEQTEAFLAKLPVVGQFK